MTETVLSVGIDIGTTTTQLVFSALEIENTASLASVPKISVANKTVIFRSEIHFTPLLSPTVIDAEGIRRIVEREYARAKVKKEDLSAGAVIITGETARKENARNVLQTLGDLAGNFVVATAGSDLEAILAGRGSGAAAFSKREHTSVANFDMGGGTTNVVVFQDGEVKDTTCLDVGGRLVRVDPDTMKLEYVAPKLVPVVKSLEILVEEGKTVSRKDLEALADRMAVFFDELMGLKPRSPLFEIMLTAHDFRQISSLDGDKRSVKYVSFSGGVADGMREIPPEGPFAYGDIGVLLGQAVNRTALCSSFRVLPAEETIRATVIGAGSHSMDISGSTIGLSDESVFPLKNLPILKLTEEDEGDGDGFSEALAVKIRWYADHDSLQQVAVSFRGKKNPSFDEVQKYGKNILSGLSEYLLHHDTIVIVVENDMGKALGYALRSLIGDGKKVVSIDGIAVDNGDYIDIGRPLAKGRVVPVVIKTLVFGG